MLKIFFGEHWTSQASVVKLKAVDLFSLMCMCVHQGVIELICVILSLASS